MEVKLNQSVQIKTFGDSMQPFFINGDILYITKKGFRQIQVNDFLTVKKKLIFITHRVIFKNDEYLITKGDNNFVPDKKVYPKQIAGVVNKIKRQGKILEIKDLYLLQSLNYLSEVKNVCAKFTAAGINFLILKGLPLHLYIENNYPKRIYSDCDFLIDKDQFALVQSILTKLGFKKVHTPLSKFHHILKDKESEITFYKKVHGVNIVLDIHFEAVFLMTQLGKLDFLYPQKLIDALTLDLLENKKLIKIQGSKFPILNLEHLIIYLSLHLFHHNFRGYYRYELIDRILKTKTVDFGNIEKILEKYRLNNFIYPVFINLLKFYQSPIPKKLIRAITPDQVALKYIQSNILKINIFEDEGRIESGKNRFKNIFYLSPNPFIIKIFIIFNLQIIYSFAWVLGIKALSQFRKITYTLTKMFLRSN